MWTEPSMIYGLGLAGLLTVVAFTAGWAIAYPTARTRGWQQGRMAGFAAGLEQGRREASQPHAGPAPRSAPRPDLQVVRTPPRQAPRMVAASAPDFPGRHALRPELWRQPQKDGRRWQAGITHTTAMPAVPPTSTEATP